MNLISNFVVSTICFLIDNAFTQNTDISNINGVVVGEKRKTLSPTLLDSITEDLRNENWNEAESECYKSLLQVLESTNNGTLWASLIWDSIQLPVGTLQGSQYLLGNYDQCLSQRWLHPVIETKYCLADVHLSRTFPQRFDNNFEPYDPTTTYISTATETGRKLNKLTWGLCVPAVCEAKSIVKVLKTLVSKSHLKPISQDPRIDVFHCQSKIHERVYPRGYYIFWYLILFLTLITIYSTYFTEDTPIKSIGQSMIKAFCMKKNMYDLIKENKDDIYLMHMYRTILASMILIFHVFLYQFPVPVTDGLAVDKETTPSLLNSAVGVDTFFAMSGLLHFKGLMEKQESFFMMMFKRYVRLVGAYAILVFYMASVLRYSGDGPLWDHYAAKEEDCCVNNWWASLLMVSNYVNIEQICHLVTWYICCEFQLIILATLMHKAYCWNAGLGKVLAVIITIAAVVLPGLTTYNNRLPAVLFEDLHSLVDVRTNAVFIGRYTRAHYRMGSFLVGMGAGWILATYKPSNHRNTVSLRWSVIIAVLSQAVFLSILTGGSHFVRVEYKPIATAVFAATNKIVWAIGASALILVTEYGTLPTFAKIYGSKVWLPLSRLTYGIYVLHPIVIMRKLYVVRGPIFWDKFGLIVDSLGMLVYTYILSLILWLLIQAPLVNIVNVFLFKYFPKKKAEDKVKKDS